MNDMAHIVLRFARRGFYDCIAPHDVAPLCAGLITTKQVKRRLWRQEQGNA